MVKTIQIAVLVLTLSLTGTSAILAEENGHGESGGKEKNWMLIAGAGAMYTPLFPGSQDHKWEPFPLLFGFYEWDYFSVFIEGESLGGEYAFTQDKMLSAKLGLNLGQSRKEEDADYLKGSGDLENPVQVFSALCYGPKWLSANLKVRYAPISHEGRNHNAFLTDIYAQSELVMIPFVVITEAGLTSMDSTWADLYYSKDAGAEKIYAKADVLLYFCEFAGIYVNGSVNHYIGGAGSSYATEEDVTFGASVGAFYMF